MTYCPRCGQPKFMTVSHRSHECGACGFTLYMNTAAAVGAIIDCDGHVLATIRADNPDKGMLDLPGGFVDHNETGERALRRELDEELGLKEFAPVYFGTYPNVYPYKSVTYHTLDLVFAVQLNEQPNITPSDDVAGVEWIKKTEIELRDFAFQSVRAALSDYISKV